MKSLHCTHKIVWKKRCRVHYKPISRSGGDGRQESCKHAHAPLLNGEKCLIKLFLECAPAQKRERESEKNWNENTIMIIFAIEFLHILFFVRLSKNKREKKKGNVIILRKITIRVHGIWNEENFSGERKEKRGRSVVQFLYGHRVSSFLFLFSRNLIFFLLSSAILW